MSTLARLVALGPAVHVRVVRVAEAHPEAEPSSAPLDVGAPALRDAEGHAARAFDAAPFRVYVLDAAGRVVYRGPRGPDALDGPAVFAALRALGVQTDGRE
ncbi:MAG: hypothetical protein M9894_20330 [Planctomycetes bacterium]|nr:hypothetical protein [Planctomycetota bacterium]